MRKRRAEKPLKSKAERFADVMEMPKDILSECSKITTYGDNQIIIENYKGILEYTNEKIRIKTGGRILCISGASLSICAITECDILIEGKFNNVGWE